MTGVRRASFVICNKPLPTISKFVLMRKEVARRMNHVMRGLYLSAVLSDLCGEERGWRLSDSMTMLLLVPSLENTQGTPNMPKGKTIQHTGLPPNPNP